MPVHIFVTSEDNFHVCIRHGLAAVPGGSKPDITNQLASRMAMIRPRDKILFYMTGKKEIHGVYRAIDRPFFDDTSIWSIPENGQTYPLRVRIEGSESFFRCPVLLSDIYDLRDNGLIWTFSLERPSGTSNSLFAISEREFEEILRLFLKVNHVYEPAPHIVEPYRHIEPNLLSQLSYDEAGLPRYESTLAALFLEALSRGAHSEVFGPYSDYLAYIPTTFQKEIDVVLLHSIPNKPLDVFAHSIIELKRDRFDEQGLAQLLRYEDWFLKKRVHGDSRAIRPIAIARSFDEKVLDYLQRRERLEGKPVKLLEYRVVAGSLSLVQRGV